MPVKLLISDAGFNSDFDSLLQMKRETSADVDEAAREIIANVRNRGDAAVIEYTARFDRQHLSSSEIAFSQREIAEAVNQVSADTLEALKIAEKRIRSHHARQVPSDDFYTDPLGVSLGTRWTAIEAVGIYVPGGTASYPSSVIMNAVPASVAGVERIAMVVPSPDGALNPLVLAAAKLAGVTEIYRIGGAQAVETP